jgi:hypothetical protein
MTFRMLRLWCWFDESWVTEAGVLPHKQHNTTQHSLALELSQVKLAKQWKQSNAVDPGTASLLLDQVFIYK